MAFMKVPGQRTITGTEGMQWDLLKITRTVVGAVQIMSIPGDTKSTQA